MRHFTSTTVRCAVIIQAGFWLLGLHTIIRGIGSPFAPHYIGGPEVWVFGGTPGDWLQNKVYATPIAFALHISWYFFPLWFGFILSRHARTRLPEYFLWLMATAIAADIVCILLPTAPPWMYSGHRALTDTALASFLAHDTNPYAAFPSLHAALPFVTALFFWYRVPALRLSAIVAFVYAVLVGMAVVYLGEHWVIDVLAAFLLAAIVTIALLRPTISSRMDAMGRWVFAAPSRPEAPLPEQLPDVASV